MNEDACCRALDLLDREVLLLDVSGSVLFANKEARALIDAPMGGDRDLGSFTGLWEERAEEVRKALRRLAGTSTWQPFTLTRASGAHGGLRMNMRARAFVAGEGDAREMRLLVTADSHRERSFEDHRRLIRHLNTRLAKGSQTETLLTTLLDNERRLHHELVHRVKNNLSLLISLLRFDRGRNEGPDPGQQLEEMERRILSIAAVHDLLDQAQETDFVRADLLIEKICREMEQAVVPGAIRIERALTPVRLHISDATPLALIVNELVTNALKHAFPGGGPGRITIELKKNGVEKLEAVVHDDGIGMTLGDDEDAGDDGGHGSLILRSLAQQLGGDIVRSVGGGTTWQLVFMPKDDPSADQPAVH